MDARTRSRFRGCLLGGAVGDALGAPVEFLSLAQIRERYGPEGIRDMDEAYGRVGAITDDTQMTLFTAEGLLRARHREMTKGITGAAVSLVRDSYMRWLHTQGVPLRAAMRARILDPERQGWLLAQKELFSQRAPGNTCLSALMHAEADSLEARNLSKGCGAVMRVAPVALYMMPLHCGDEFKHAEAFRLAMALAGITHGHPTAKCASGVLASLILGILQEEKIEAALDRAMALLRQHESRGETERAIEKARSLAGDEVPADEAIPQLGEGWVSEEALAIAIYCALTSSDFEVGVRTAVSIEGDSDSTGSITGQILGALHGEEAIPARWSRELELRKVIGDVAEDFSRVHEARDLERDDYWVERYPPS